MFSTPLNQGFLPTSTPVQSLGDSGYFSNCDKSPSDKKLQTLSPIKEISNFKRLNDFVELFPFESPCIHFNHPNEVTKVLDFSSVDFLGDGYTCEFKDEDNSFPSFQIHDLSDKQDKKLLKRIPIDSDRHCCSVNFHQNVRLVNEYNILSHVNKNAPVSNDSNKDQFVEFKTTFKLRNKVDFLLEFEKRNLYSIVSLMLSFLSAEDLCRVSCVNKNWNKAVQHDSNANCRRKAFLKEKYSQKENHYHSVSSLKISLEEKRNPQGGEHKTALYNLCNFEATSKQPLKKQATTKFESFVKEGAQEKNSILMKCPRCNYAAKSQLRNAYLCTECNYAFCQKCLGPFLKSHTCSTSKKVSMVIGSKQSKRNLKRL